MFRCHSIIWVSLLWSLIFSYTFMTHLGISPIARTSVLGTSIAFIIFGATLLVYEGVAKYTKILLWVAAWSVLILIGLIFFTQEYISDTTLNVWITIVSFLASICWFFVSHTDRVTEPGLHWYIWSLISTVVVSSAFNNTSSLAILIYIVMCAILVLVNIVYLMYILRYQQNNQRRCRQLWRISNCFTVSTALLVGSILFKTENLTSNLWSEYIMSVQVFTIVIIIIDSILGFSNKHTYDSVDQLPSDV